MMDDYQFGDDAWNVADPILCPICGRESCDDHVPGDPVPPRSSSSNGSEPTYADRLARAIETERLRRDAQSGFILTLGK